MEKRNFVTPIRTSGVSDVGDELVNAAKTAFGGEMSKKASEYEKKASKEDEKTDSRV